MDMQNINYRRIDANGALDSSDAGLYVANNIFQVMGETWDFTIEELATAGFVGLIGSDHTYHNGMTGSDTEIGDITDNGDGTFTQTYVVTELSAAQKQDRFITSKRNSVLMLSDWTQAADTPLNDATKALWRTYRQAIRDLPSTITWSDIDTSFDITWPVQPGAAVPDAATSAAANPFLDSDADGTPD